MALEVGAIVEGKVTGITKFGAFVELPGGKTGMVHISEIASTYVKEIRDFIQENQIVRVKVFAITPDGKINLSIKRAVEQPQPAPRSHAPQQKRPYQPSGRRMGPGSDVAFGRAPAAPQTFEEMMTRFKQTSDDKMSDIRRNLDGKRGTSRSRGGHGRP
jgi:S1 RNA binding domain protein